MPHRVRAAGRGHGECAAHSGGRQDGTRWKADGEGQEAADLGSGLFQSAAGDRQGRRRNHRNQLLLVQSLTRRMVKI